MNHLQMLQALQQKGFMIGSVRLGLDNPKDEDWVVRQEDWEKITGGNHEAIDAGFKYLPHEYDQERFQCFFLERRGTLYNFIIPRTDVDYRVEKLTIKLLLRIPKYLIQDKKQRVIMAERIKEGLRQLIYVDNIESYSGTGDDIPF